MKRAAAAPGNQTRLILGRSVSINRAGSHAEAVLHGQGNARGHVLFQFRQGHENVAVFIGMVEIVALVHQAATRNHEARILLSESQVVGVFEFHAGRAPRKSRGSQLAWSMNSSSGSAVDMGLSSSRIRVRACLGPADGPWPLRHQDEPNESRLREDSPTGHRHAGEIELYGDGFSAHQFFQSRQAGQTWRPWSKSLRARTHDTFPRPPGLPEQGGPGMRTGRASNTPAVAPIAPRNFLREQSVALIGPDTLLPTWQLGLTQ